MARQKKYNPNWRRSLLAKIHMGRKQLGMDDDDYRFMLADRYDVDSAGALSMNQLDDLKKHMENLGASFTKAKPSGKPYVRKIYALWGELQTMGVIKQSGKEPCIAWVQRQTKGDTPDGKGVQSPEWLTREQAMYLIEALKDWIAREIQEQEAE
jgi:hypothetical protein